jgi:hypothetical protein
MRIVGFDLDVSVRILEETRVLPGYDDMPTGGLKVTTVPETKGSGHERLNGRRGFPEVFARFCGSPLSLFRDSPLVRDAMARWWVRGFSRRCSIP